MGLFLQIPTDLFAVINFWSSLLVYLFCLEEAESLKAESLKADRQSTDQRNEVCAKDRSRAVCFRMISTMPLFRICRTVVICRQGRAGWDVPAGVCC